MMKKIIAGTADAYLSEEFQDKVLMAFIYSVHNYLDDHESEITSKYKQILLRKNKNRTPEQLDASTAKFMDDLLIKLIESIDLNRIGFDGIISRAIRGDGDMKLDREVDKIMQHLDSVPILACISQIAVRVASRVYA
jgi:hypothetical protein